MISLLYIPIDHHHHNHHHHIIQSTILSQKHIKIRNVEKVFLYALHYVSLEAVHKHLCLSIARQNVPFNTLDIIKAPCLLTVLRILASSHETTIHTDFARVIYTRCISGIVSNSSLHPNTLTLESNINVNIQLEALKSLQIYFPDFESISIPILKTCLELIRGPNGDLRDEASSFICSSLTSSSASSSPLSPKIPHVVTTILSTQRIDIPTIRVAASCVPFSCEKRLVELLLLGFSHSSIAVSEMALDAMIRKAQEEDDPRKSKQKTIWSSSSLWIEMFPRILLKAQIREEDDEDEFSRYRRAYLREASELSSQALGLPETLFRLHHHVSTTSSWVFVESAMFVLWCVSYVLLS